MSTQHYGWLPDLPDHRDICFCPLLEEIAALPPRVDLRPQCPPVYDQGQLGSCTANAIAGAIQFARRKQNLNPIFTPSRLFIYFNERVMEHTITSDSGAQIRDGVKSVAKQGVCPETEWAYNIARFAERPPFACYDDAHKFKAVKYQRIAPTLNHLRACLASGYPFVFGFTVYESFESPEVAKTGVVPTPSKTEKALGGHAVMAVGYDDDAQVFFVRNSWSEKWGMGGYFTLPYSYLTDDNLAADFWKIITVT